MAVSPEKAAIIVEKAEFVDRCIQILVERQSVELEEYGERIEIKDVVERRLEMMTQACIDIARILLNELDVPVPKANADAMRELAAQGVITASLGEAMAQACGLRNVLAHEYGDVIENVTVYRALQDLSRYRTFLVEVREFLAERNAI